MTVPEIALTYLIVIWTLLFFALSLGIFLLVRKVDRGLDMFNEILTTTRDVATNVAAPINILAEGVRSFAGERDARRKKTGSGAATDVPPETIPPAIDKP